MILILTWRVQNELKPYKDEKNNELEMIGIAAGIVSLCANLAYNLDSTQTINLLDLTVLILSLWINSKFILEWVYLLTITLSQKHKFVRIVSSPSHSLDQLFTQKITFQV